MNLSWCLVTCSSSPIFNNIIFGHGKVSMLFSEILWPRLEWTL